MAQRRAQAPLRPRNVRYPEPTPERLRPYRGRRRRSGVPWFARLFLALALVVLAGASAVAAGGIVGGAVAGFAGTVGDIFIAQLGGPTPTPRPLLPPGAPRLVLTGTGWTNENPYPVRGFVPADLGDQRGYAVRVYVNGELAGEQPLRGTRDFEVRVTIPDGPSLISATIAGPAGEGSESVPIEVTFDDTPPPLKISSPRDGATVDAETVRVRGTTQPGASVTVRNETNGGRASGVAGEDGAFSIRVSITGGPNALVVTATDPAGNTKTVDRSVTGKGGAATASVSLTKGSFKLGSLPAALGATVRVLGPDGKPIDGARVVFTIQIPGVGPVQSPELTTVNGTASFNTLIPVGAAAGTGLVTVVVETDRHGTLSGTAEFKIS